MEEKEEKFVKFGTLCMASKCTTLLFRGNFLNYVLFLL